MSRNGSGAYSLPSGNPFITGTTISSTTMNSTMSDIATALTNSLAANGETPVTANIPMNSKKITGLASPTTAGDALAYGSNLTVGNSNDAGSTVLDWYLEGTFTPTAVGITVAGTTTYTSQVGKYTRIGNVIHVQAAIAWSGMTGTGGIAFGGLPVAASWTTAQVMNVSAQQPTYSGKSLNVTIANGQTSGAVNVNTSGGAYGVTDNPASGFLYVYGSYFV